MITGETENMTAKSEEVNMLLAEVWGEESLLSKIADPISPEEAKQILETGNTHLLTGRTLLYTLDNDGKVIGSIGMKITNPTTLEIGSIAISEDFRGRGLSPKLYGLIRNDLQKLVFEHHMSVSAYGTIGSPVLNHIIDSLAGCLDDKVQLFPTNIAPFIIPVSQTFIHEPFALTNGTGSYTSTTEILSINEEQEYSVNGSTLLPELSQLFKLFPEALPAKPNESSTNFQIDLPIRMDLYIVNDKGSTEEQLLKDIKKDKPCQIRIPLNQESAPLIRSLMNSKLLLTGITISDERTYICFLTEEHLLTSDMLYSLAYMEIPQIPSLANALISINSRRGIFKPRGFNTKDTSVFQLPETVVIQD